MLHLSLLVSTPVLLGVDGATGVEPQIALRLGVLAVRADRDAVRGRAGNASRASTKAGHCRRLPG